LFLATCRINVSKTTTQPNPTTYRSKIESMHRQIETKTNMLTHSVVQGKQNKNPIFKLSLLISLKLHFVLHPLLYILPMHDFRPRV